MIDLHTHSNVSDGTDSPAQLISKAHAQGLKVIALTDHDSTAGWDAAMAALDRKSTRLNSSHIPLSRMPSSA